MENNFRLRKYGGQFIILYVRVYQAKGHFKGGKPNTIIIFLSLNALSGLYVFSTAIFLNQSILRYIFNFLKELASKKKTMKCLLK